MRKNTDKRAIATNASNENQYGVHQKNSSRRAKSHGLDIASSEDPNNSDYFRQRPIRVRTTLDCGLAESTDVKQSSDEIFRFGFHDFAHS